MSDDPSNFSDSSVTPALNTTNAAPSTDLVHLPGLNLLEGDSGLVSNTSDESVKIEISSQGDVNNNLTQHSNTQEVVVPVNSDTIMEETEASILRNQRKSEIDIQHNIPGFPDNSGSENVATKQEQDDVIIKDTEVQVISAHETKPESVNAVLENETDKEPTEQLELRNKQIETVTVQIQPPTELEELNEPTKVVLEKKEEKCFKSSTHPTDSAAVLPETNFIDIIDENEKQQNIIVEQKDEQNTLQPIAVSKSNELDAIDRALNNELMHYSSDDEIKQCESEIDVTKNKIENSNNSDSSNSSISSSDSESDSDSDSDNDENSRKRGNQELDEDDLSDDNDDNTEGPVKSAHEILDEPAPKIPDNLKITPQTQIEHVGEIFSVTGKTVVIKASVSGEFRVLEEHSVFCTSDRVPFGVLYETFGRVQAPFYSVKFESEEEAAPFKSRRGEKVFYVVSASKFLFTDKIKAIKGSDASNFHDEEVPEEEQEFSDDEKERMATSMKKSKKKKKKTKHDDADQPKNTEGSIVASTTGNFNSVGSNRPSRNNRGKPARGRGGFQSHPYQSHNTNFGQSTDYQNSYNNHVYGQSYNLPNSGGNFGQPINQQYNMGVNSGNPNMPYYNSQQQQYNPQQPYFNSQQQGQQQQHQYQQQQQQYQQQYQQQQQQQQQQYQQQQQQFYNPLQQHQFQMMQQIMMNLNNNATGNQMSPPPGLTQQQGSSSFSYQQQQPQGPPGRQGQPRSYDTDLNYGGGSN